LFFLLLFVVVVVGGGVGSGARGKGIWTLP